LEVVNVDLNGNGASGTISRGERRGLCCPAWCLILLVGLFSGLGIGLLSMYFGMKNASLIENKLDSLTAGFEPSPQKVRVVVIGGGIAGHTAMYEMAQKSKIGIYIYI
jgi:hypothetical protein